KQNLPSHKFSSKCGTISSRSGEAAALALRQARQLVGPNQVAVAQVEVARSPLGLLKSRRLQPAHTKRIAVALGYRRGRRIAIASKARRRLSTRLIREGR